MHQLAPIPQRAVTPSSRAPMRYADTQSAHDVFASVEGSLNQTGEDEVWMISYMDIMTLLLTLFVLLLAYAHMESVSGPVSEQTQIPTHNAYPAALPAAQPLLTSIEQISLPMAGIGVAQRSYIALPENVASQPVVVPLQAEPEAPLLQTEDSQIAVLKETSPLLLAEASPVEQPADTSDTVTLRNSFLETIQASALGDRIEVTTHQNSINLEISDNILFEPGSAALKPFGQQLLNELAVLLVNQPYAVSVEGHTDNVPIENIRFASNWELSSTRATNVTRYLIDHGITAGRLRAIGYADTRPRTDNITVEGRSRNRRVSLILQLPQGQEIADTSAPAAA
ncbi:MAG: OmpA family protein [Gammaproteobacteria bacterium]|nr:OmpA family protein [Gammaproteobacteria bacterium]